ncbi:hypothetical protein FG93_03738 [Bosea sp. LC85]|nr:hypothetical protein FG93_03738 [Bosea sp. LC85]
MLAIEQGRLRLAREALAGLGSCGASGDARRVEIAQVLRSIIIVEITIGKVDDATGRTRIRQWFGSEDGWRGARRCFVELRLAAHTADGLVAG